MDEVMVTGSAGFIGYHLSKKLLEMGTRVIGVDNVNRYYDPSLKESRLADLERFDEFVFHREDVSDKEALDRIIDDNNVDRICNLAAQAGVRYSIEHPFSYLDSNIVGFLNILEICRHRGIDHLVYASSSSVYGGNDKIPFSAEDRVDSPISLYAATKKSNELMAHVYSHLYGLNTTGLRFFTVYGPYGRPDMALFKFTDAIMDGRTIDVYNYGKMQRDFTYVDDIVDGIISSLEKPFRYEIFNLGNNNPVQLEYFIERIEKELGRTAEKNYLPMQPGDVPRTFADIDHSRDLLGYDPKISIEEGIKRFIGWYLDYYDRV
ncbi:MAG: NAD-dependent epimerase [Thermoplasmatota archaeon]